LTVNRFDQASRYGAKLDPQGFVRWLLGDPSLTFQGWLDTRSLPFPGEPDSTCDTVARLIAVGEADKPWALAIEFQTRPDGTIFGRFLEYLGRLWRERRPDTGTRRFRVGAALVNLTGRRRTASRRMRLGQSRVRTFLGVTERNLAREDASATLTGIENGTVARCLLPWVPLMRGGGKAAIIARWVTLAQAEPDRHLRADYGGLALVFAELTRYRQKWQKALEGWNVVESQQVLEWMAQGEAKGEAKGEARGILRAQREILRMLLEDKYGPLPPALVQQIESTQEIDRLRNAIRQVPHLHHLGDLQL
jgi:hypothetical protein